ncbi:hypothetical protein HPB50_016618 [Hyalomma asiaticum]|uniref:Uncharacterized protein n=1 Tax=Hyalomma asiaticum TaxID=266040 RepID=A0ACB7TII6_HYAAI|nr:hypothetical protein HPB50_016618 [Hyalomma asiaticum]
MEELQTIVAKVEGTQNNQPLTYVYGEPNEPMPPTPADLIGGRQQRHDGENRPPNNRDIEEEWKSRCEMVRAWWKRWHHEYIKEIGATVKAQARNVKPLSVDGVVLIEDRCPRTFWKMCQTEKTYSGRDRRTVSCLLRKSSKDVLKICKHLTSGGLLQIARQSAQVGRQDSVKYHHQDCRR